MSVEPNLKDQFVAKFKNIGPLDFYRFLIVSAMKVLVEIKNETYSGTLPNLQLIILHDEFLKLHRREGEENYLEIAKICRKAAHKVYRVMLKKQMVQKDPKFLTLV